MTLINAREYEEIDINALAENTAAKGVTATHNDMIAKNIARFWGYWSKFYNSRVL
jgi:hypothetical protein